MEEEKLPQDTVVFKYNFRAKLLKLNKEFPVLVRIRIKCIEIALKLFLKIFIFYI